MPFEAIVSVFSRYLLSQVLFSSLQFRLARYSPQTMKKCLKCQKLLIIHVFCIAVYLNSIFQRHLFFHGIYKFRPEKKKQQKNPGDFATKLNIVTHTYEMYKVSE